MSEHQKTLADLTDGVPSGECDLRDDIIEIAERALWNPANISAFEIQKIAAAIVAHTRRCEPKKLSPIVQEQRDRLW